MDFINSQQPMIPAVVWAGLFGDVDAEGAGDFPVAEA
jgi:hypothetical protein